MRACLVMTIAVLCAARPLAGGQEPVRHDPAIEALVADTGMVPPEFAADALIRLSGSPKVTQAAWRREMLDEAFIRAYGAQEQYRRSTPAPVPPDSRQGAELLANTTSLTRVSLQVRATQLMTFVDPLRARELFEWIELNLAPGVCEDPLVPEVDEYYTALSLLARTSFDANRGDGLNFFELYLWRAHLPSEMPAVARAILRFRPRTDEATYLEGLFRWLLETSSQDARGFSTSALDIVARIADLQDAHRALGVLNWHLMDTLKTYLGAQLKGPRCSDSVTESSTPSTFNAALKRIKADLDVKPMDADAVRPSKMQGIARIDAYWQTPDARALHDAVGRLWGPGPMPVPLKTRQTADWRNQAERLVTDLEQWGGKREATERDYFYQKALIFTTLLDLVPPGGLRSRAIRAFVDYLRHSDVDRDRRMLWFAFVTRLLDMARSGDRREILAALEDTHHPILSLYARMERVVPSVRQ